MYICVCRAVTQRHIEHAVERGITRMRDLREHLGVTSECGRCGSCAHQCLKAALVARPTISWSDQAMQALSAVFPHEVEASS